MEISLNKQHTSVPSTDIKMKSSPLNNTIVLSKTGSTLRHLTSRPGPVPISLHKTHSHKSSKVSTDPLDNLVPAKRSRQKHQSYRQLTYPLSQLQEQQGDAPRQSLNHRQISLPRTLQLIYNNPRHLQTLPLIPLQPYLRFPSMRISFCIFSSR